MTPGVQATKRLGSDSGGLIVLVHLLALQPFEAPGRLLISVGARKDRKYETNAIFLKNKIDRAILALSRQPESHRTSTF